MSDNLSFHDRVLEAYVESDPASLAGIARESGISAQDCEKSWDALAGIGAKFRDLPMPEPSQMAVNRISAHAREAAAKHHAGEGRLAFLMGLFRPGYAFASFATLFIVTMMGMQARQAADPSLMTASRTQVLAPATGLAPSASLEAGIPDVSTPLDFRLSLPQFVNPQRRYQLSGPASLASPVSFGEAPERLQIEDPLDGKIKAQVLLNEKDLDGLFFRARKSERQGYYGEALKDYQLIANFYPGYFNIKSVRLAIANCLAALDRKDQAITTLEKFEDSYGVTEDIERWIDELKSESF